jgi:hypothetical protein
LSYIKSGVLFFIASFLVTASFAQKNPIRLPAKFSDNWKAVGEAKNITSEFKALVYGEYGLKSVFSRQYSNGKNKVIITAFETEFTSQAFGLMTLERGRGKIGSFQNGKYFFRATPWDENISQKINLSQLVAELKNDEFSEMPTLQTNLPGQGKIPESEKFILGKETLSQTQPFTDFKDVIDFTGGTQIAIADYENKMSLMIVEYQTPQFATDGAVKLQQHFDAQNPENKNTRIIRRVGNYVVEGVNVSDQKAAEELIKQIKYAPKVYWEGKGVTDLPMEQRPPDPYILNETIQTGKFIVATFYTIGILAVSTIFLGIFFGGVFFYTRKAKRKRMGMADGFSDSGGLTTLNLLDDYLLSGHDQPTKMLGDGK